MPIMWTPTSDEEKERAEEVSKIRSYRFPEIILANKRVRELRWFLFHLGFPTPVPNIDFIYEYCKKYGPDEGSI